MVDRQASFDQCTRNSFGRVPDHICLLRQAHEIVHVLRVHQKDNGGTATKSVNRFAAEMPATGTRSV